MNKFRPTDHNWLVMKINNKAFEDHRSVIRGRVIDLGCGRAQYKEDILEGADEYIGVDWESSALDQSNVDVFADLGRKFPFEDDYADTVVSFQALEHIAEPLFFLQESLRILKPGAAIFLTVPFMWHVHDAPHDYFRYTRFGLERLLSQSGFVEIQIKENTGFWQMVALKFNYQTSRRAKGVLRLFFVPVWWLLQKISPLLDAWDFNPNETGSYAVVARKPGCP